MPVYCFGSNEHHQVDPRAPLHLLEPRVIENSSKIVAASWSQSVVSDALGVTTVRGLSLENDSFDKSSVQCWLGQDEFVAVLLNDGTIRQLDDGATTERRYRLAAMNSRGEILVVPGDNATELLLYSDVSALFETSSTKENQPHKLSLPFYPSTSSSPEHISSISAGASHFLILASPSCRLFSLGDNRYGQLGVNSTHVSSSSDHPSPQHVDAFDGLRISQISAGAFHSVVLTEGGQVYFFGSDQRGQCGGTGGGSEPALNDTIEEKQDGGGEENEANEIVQVCAFGESTILRTRGGEIWVAGLINSDSSRRRKQFQHL
ncbi:uncharacterized protein JCM6883_002986 [Sporobolomyces salmoneus]|uniref:uncharacterized protein n=1 Tax=Sporobolomyces salmoneus TaxID=183962 RepID=UPI003177D169